MTEIFWLSIIQGVTEFLPISSSAHLAIFSDLFNFKNNNLTLDVSLHLGSFLAILYFFKNDIYNFAKNKKIILLIIIGSLPTLIVGFLIIQLNVIDYLRTIKIIGWATLVFGIILYFSDLKKEEKKIYTDLNLKNALIIGFFQIFSLIPGVSRSGITITAARYLNFSRIEAAKISFLLSIPTLLATSLYSIQKLIFSNNIIFITQNYLGIILAFVFSYITIKYFIEYLKKFSLTIFVLYRIFLGAIILLYVY